MKKFLSFLFIAAAAVVGFTSCSDDDKDGSAASGIQTVTLTPEGSDIAYSCTVDHVTRIITNSNNPIEWTTTDAAMAQTVVKTTSMIGSTVYYNGQAVGADGIIVDATKPFKLVARGNGGEVTYTVAAVRATSAGDQTLVQKSSEFKGIAGKLLDYDMAYFNGKFYAAVTSLAGEVENYDIYTSVTGTQWEKVEYTVSNREDCVIGGEGARLQVFNNRLYLIGGARTQGADKYGNEAEVSDGWFGPSPTVSEFRMFSTADGQTWQDDTEEDITYKMTDETILPMPDAPAYMTIDAMLAQTLANTAVLDGKLFIRGGYYPSYGMWQPRQVLVQTNDCKYFERVLPATDAPTAFGVLMRDAFIAFNGKLYTIGGFKMFPSANNITSHVYSTTDCVNWEDVAELPEEMANIFSATAVTNGKAVYLIGGEFFNMETGEKTFNTKVFRSTDMANWEVVAEVPEAFGGRRTPRAIVQGDVCWIFGGITTNTTNTYGYTADTDVFAADTWVLKMD